MPLFEITRHLTRADDSFDRAAILRAAWAEMSVVPGLELAQALRRRWRAARFERDTNRDLARRNRAHAAAIQALEADARRIAAGFGYDVERLRFEVDRWRYRCSTARAVELPRFEAALRLAREHCARQAQDPDHRNPAPARGGQCGREDGATCGDVPSGLPARVPAGAGQSAAGMADERDASLPARAGGSRLPSRRSA